MKTRGAYSEKRRINRNEKHARREPSAISSTLIDPLTRLKELISPGDQQHSVQGKVDRDASKR